MYTSQNIKRTKYLGQRHPPFKPVAPTPPSEEILPAEEALLLVLGAGVQQLDRPLEAVLNLSEALLAQADPSSSLAADLDKIIKETRRMSEITRGLRLILD